MDTDPKPPLRTALVGLLLTGAIYLAALAGFLAMIWTLFQLLIWWFTG